MIETTNELAYVLGFIWADGWIFDGKYSKEIRVECIQDDLELLLPTFQQTGKWNIHSIMLAKG